MYSKDFREEFGLKHAIFMTQYFALRCNIHCTHKKIIKYPATYWHKSPIFFS